MGKLDLEALKTESGNLSDEQELALRDQALKELEEPENKLDDEEVEEKEEKPEVKKPENKEGDEDDGDDAAKKAEKEAAAKKESEAAKQKTLDEALAKKDEERSAEEKGLVKVHEADLKKKDEEAFTQEAEEYADSENVTIDIAKNRITKIREAIKKFDGDPKKMAKALYHTQAAFARSQNELQAFKNAPKDGEIVIQGKKLSKEEAKEFVVSKYKEAYPEITDGMEDEKVFVLAKKEMQERYKLLSQKQESELKEGAEKKRAEILEKIEDRDKPFAEDVKKALDRVDPAELLDENFSLVDYVFWARGKRYHKDVSEAEKRGYERGLQEKKILGKKGEGASGSGNSGSAKGGKSTPSLNAEQKERALQMFDMQDIPEERKFELYLEYLKDQK